MLTETLVCLAIISGVFAISYPAVDAIKGYAEEQAAIQKILKRHNENYRHFNELTRPTEFDGVLYYPNGTIKACEIYTKKHKIVIGKFNTVRVERK